MNKHPGTLTERHKTREIIKERESAPLLGSYKTGAVSAG
jgi:hypothetical protein